MKKILLLLILLIPVDIFASGVLTVDKNEINFKKGNHDKLVISGSNIAGRIDLKYDNKYVKLSENTIWIDNDDVTIDVKGIKKGNTTIKVKTTDVATYDEEIYEEEFDINVNITDNGKSNYLMYLFVSIVFLIVLFIVFKIKK